MNQIQFRFILLIFLWSTASTAFSQIELGVYGGPTRLSISGDKPKFSIYRPGPGLTTGIILNIPVSKDIQISLQPGLSLENARSRTADTISYYFIKHLEYRDSIYYKFQSFYFPVLFRVLSDNHRFQFTTGIEFLYMFNIRADNGADRFNLEHEYNKFNAAAQFGVGYIIPVRKTRFSVNFQYSQSLLNWSDNDPDNSYIPRIKTSGLRLLMAWTIPVSNKKLNLP